MPARIANITIDSQNAGRLAQFWAAALGWTLVSASKASATIEPTETGVALYFEQVPERKTAKSRLHFDLDASASPAAEMRRLLLLGATKVREHSHRTVLADPEGNEFCLLGKPE
jgi:predicted enzyme related to lactoylglutathione lyase